jgi:hypothetical protein
MRGARGAGRGARGAGRGARGAGRGAARASQRAGGRGRGQVATRNRLLVTFDWVKSYLFGRDVTRF